MLTPPFYLPHTCISIQNQSINKPATRILRSVASKSIKTFLVISIRIDFHVTFTDARPGYDHQTMKESSCNSKIDVVNLCFAINCILLSSAFLGPQSVKEVAVALVHLSPSPSTLHSDTGEHNYCSIKNKMNVFTICTSEIASSQKSKTSHFPSNSSFGWT